MIYPFGEIENKWQKYWEAHETFCVREDPAKKKLFVLDMFPYPSGAGLHVGHPEGYAATDIFCRFKRMNSFNVLHPIGWDAFGLPAERYAMQTNIHPRLTTVQNIDTFRRQIKMLGLSYDWSRELDTTDPAYYKWTQWIFLQIYNSWYDRRAQKARPIAELEEELRNAGSGRIPDVPEQISAAAWNRKTRKEKHDFLAEFRLAYLAEIPVNWCEALGTVLANEEVAEWVEKGYTVERRPMRQWMMRITAYADRMLEDSKRLDWPSSTVEQQRNWIGRSDGALINFEEVASKARITIFTTRPDTIFGATYLVLAPEHPLVDSLTGAGARQSVDDYRAKAKLKSDVERGADTEKTGIFIGAHATNPATRQAIPIWIADYVLMGYGTGAIMAVPAHDSRDHSFAHTFGLPTRSVVTGGIDNRDEAWEGDGISMNSDFLNGLPTPQAKEKTIGWLESERIGKRSVHYKLRDWLFSRQRYWGEPIPIIHLDDGTMSTVPEEELPLLLPDLKKFQPSGTTESPLALAKEWVNVIDPQTGLQGRRETNTMPQWAGSCWYYLRYADPRNPDAICAKEKEKYWLPIDLYVGGAEHAVLHLMYARFWHKVLYDLGHVSTPEPFMKLRHQGTILGEDSRKMSKSRGNVVNPDDVVKEYGADSMRLFEMFMGPLEETKPWSTRGVEGVHRFLNRVWRMIVDGNGDLLSTIRNIPLTSGQERLLHQTIRKISEDIATLNFNTAISQMMIFVNEFLNLEVKPRHGIETFVLLLSPFAPHIAEELWSKLGHTESLAYESWPSYDESKTTTDTIEMVVQVNGKVRSKFPVALDVDDESLRKLVMDDENVKKYIAGKSIDRIVVVKNRLVSVVVK